MPVVSHRGAGGGGITGQTTNTSATSAVCEVLNTASPCTVFEAQVATFKGAFLKRISDPRALKKLLAQSGFASSSDAPPPSKCSQEFWVGL